MIKTEVKQGEEDRSQAGEEDRSEAGGGRGSEAGVRKAKVKQAEEGEIRKDKVYRSDSNQCCFADTSKSG